ncbi:hypothetical protein P3W85_30015 [Cupriavidus basilensis]|uniref:Sialate O-acetylesterase domain-containing protein n=1 Tax=Cupriavidus basilensis TaxID=68895 RepID=A0ABT6AX17_9BURK|nr:hypothetical protein [Cupriavidus basilensis]MDF3837160.1 hypothetical protein [Cupriavidus basilensis]
MPTANEFTGSAERIVANGDRWEKIITGPAAGPDSLVDAPGGPIPTVRRVLAEVPSAQADRAAAEAAAVAAEGKADAAEVSAAASDAARLATEAARDSTQVLVNFVGSIAEGLSKTTDGQYFSIPSGVSAEYVLLYRNVAGAPVLQKRWPSADAVDNVRKDFARAGAADYTGKGNILPFHADQFGHAMFGFNLLTGEYFARGLLSASQLPAGIESALGKYRQAEWIGTGPIIPFEIDQMGRVTRGYDLVKKKPIIAGIAVSAEAAGPTRLEDLPAALKPVAKTVNQLLLYGESTSVGAASTPPISLQQPYYNITFRGGPRAWSGVDWDFGPFKPLVEDAVSPSPDGFTNRGEAGCAGAANYATTLAALDGHAPADHVILASTAGHGGYKISQLKKGTAQYAILLRHVTEAKAQAPDIAVHAVYLRLGINDSAAQTPYAAYRADVEQLQADIEADIKVITGQTGPVFMLLNQICYGARTWSAQALAHLDLAKKNSKFVFVTPEYQFPVAGDGIHMSNIGSKWSSFFAGRVYKQLVRDGKKPKWLDPISATRRGAEIRVRFDVPCLPLVLDTKSLALTTDSGFKVLDGANPATILSIAIEGDELVITLAVAPAGASTVRHGLDYQGAGLTAIGGGSGNLRDSTPGIETIGGVSCPLYNICPMFEMPVVALGE